MNFTFKPFGNKNWSIDGKKIIWGNEVYFIDEIIDVSFLMPKKWMNGAITVNFLNKNRLILAFGLKQKEEGQAVYNYIQKNSHANKEVRLLCKVCGNISCYTNADVQQSEYYKQSAKIDSFTSTMTSLFVSQYQGFEYEKKAEAAKKKIIDFSKCPHCNSTNISVLSDEEFEKIKAEQDTATPVSTLSSADELKKYKELLDSGVITQEEFDAKKKQLLGL